MNKPTNRCGQGDKGQRTHVEGYKWEERKMAERVGGSTKTKLCLRCNNET